MTGKQPTKEKDKHIGSRIRMARNLSGCSQAQLGNKLGLTFQQVQKYESGRNRVAASTLWSISEILGRPIGFFYGVDDKISAGLSLDDRQLIELAKKLNRIESDHTKSSLIKFMNMLATKS